MGQQGVHPLEGHHDVDSVPRSTTRRSSGRRSSLPQLEKFGWQEEPCAKALSTDSNYHESDHETVS